MGFRRARSPWTRWQRAQRWSVSLGVDPFAAMGALRKLPRFTRELKTYKKANTGPEFALSLSEIYPVLGDYGAPAGGMTPHYFFQDLWAARKIFLRRPPSHLDVGSRIDGFVAHLLAFMPVTVVDIRPMPRIVEGLSFVQDDATYMTNFPSDSVESLSSLHALEHFGLGRYGDPIDPKAWATGMRSLARVLRPGGRLYLSVPIGTQRVEFNAHRVFDPFTIMDTLADLRMLSFSAEDDDGRFLNGGNPADYREARYACGMFEFTKD